MAQGIAGNKQTFDIEMGVRAEIKKIQLADTGER